MVRVMEVGEGSGRGRGGVAEEGVEGEGGVSLPAWRWVALDDSPSWCDNVQFENRCEKNCCHFSGGKKPRRGMPLAVETFQLPTDFPGGFFPPEYWFSLRNVACCKTHTKV